MSLLSKLANPLFSFLFQYAPEYTESIKGFQHYLFGNGTDREIPDSLLEELINSTRKSILESGTNSPLVVDYRHYSYGRSIHERSNENYLFRFTPLGLLIGGYLLTSIEEVENISEFKGKLWKVTMEDYYDWDGGVQDIKLPEKLLKYIPKFLFNKLGIYQEEGDWYVNETKFELIGKSFYHRKTYLVCENPYWHNPPTTRREKQKAKSYQLKYDESEYLEEEYDDFIYNDED